MSPRPLITPMITPNVFARHPRRALLIALPVVTLVALATWAASTPNLARALESQRALVAKSPASAPLRVDFANLLQLDGRLAEAEDQYREAIALDGRLVAARFNLGLLLQARGEERAALREFKEVVDIEPRHAWAHYQIGAVLERQGRESAAIHAYARAFAYDPRLRYPDVNPHVIDNQLLTRATLEAYRHRDDLVGAPRSYEEQRRMAALLRETATDGEATTAVTPTPATPNPPPAPPAPSAPSPVPGTMGQAPGRVIGAQDVVAGSQSGLVGGGTGRTQPSRLYQTPHYQPAPIVDEGQAYDAESGDPQPGSPLVPGAVFVPGTDSTGRLEMHRPTPGRGRLASGLASAG